MDLALFRTRAAEMGTALYRSVLDSNDVEALLLGEEITSVGRMAKVAQQLEASVEGRAILAERPTIGSDTVDLAELAALPEGSLGRTYVEHLERNGLDIDALGTRVTRGAAEQDNYLLERVRQTHDIWHTMLGLGTEPYEEILVHAFQWDQLFMPYSALVVSIGTLKHLLPERRWPLVRRGLRQARRAGRDASPLLAVYWEKRWDEDIDDLRRWLGVRPASAWGVGLA